MSYWSEYKVVCVGCNESHLERLCERGTSREPVLWCPNCGTVLMADPHGPISGTDWHVPVVVFDDKRHCRAPYPRPVKN